MAKELLAGPWPVSALAGSDGQAISVVQLMRRETGLL